MTNEVKPERKRVTTDSLNGREAVFGFAAWLTTRSKPVTFSARHDASEAARLAAEFCDHNNLADVTENWPNNMMNHPED